MGGGESFARTIVSNAAHTQFTEAPGAHSEGGSPCKLKPTYPPHGLHAHHTRNRWLHEHAHATKRFVTRCQPLQTPDQLAPQVFGVAHRHHRGITTQPPVFQGIAESCLNRMQSSLSGVKLRLQPGSRQHSVCRSEACQQRTCLQHSYNLLSTCSNRQLPHPLFASCTTRRQMR